MKKDDLLEGKYRILSILGQGGMGKVYLAENINLGTLWAIKELLKESESKVNLFIEPNILKKLNHPALPRVFDIFEDDTNIYIVVDYIKGKALDKIIDEEGCLSENKVLDWAIQLCDVLNYLHSVKPNPIIYRDMKPSNVILTDGGYLKLIDFGIAREYKEEAGSDTVCIGTRGYAAPEQYGAGQTNELSDIYSLGVTLYHMLTRKTPNEAPFEIKPVRYFNKTLSPEIEEVIFKCTRQDPKERYQSMEELSEAIRWVTNSNRSEESNEELLLHSNIHDNNNKVFKKSISFKKTILTIWDNAEFACELAYTAAKKTNLNIVLVDLNLLSPKTDLYLNVKKYPEGIISEGMLINSGINIVLDSIEKNFFTHELLIKASVKRKELKNLFILTGNYDLDNYEYYKNESLIKLIEKCYQQFDIVILIVERSIYDSYTVISLTKSDFNLIPIRADIDTLREYNNYLTFLRDKQKIPIDKTKFIAYEYDPAYNLSVEIIRGVTERNYHGHVSYSKRRAKYRNLKLPYARRMEDNICAEYVKILNKLKIPTNIGLREKIKSFINKKMNAIFIKLPRRKVKNAHSELSPQAFTE